MVVAALLSIVLGLGMPTPSAYILAAVLVGPLMNQVGVDTLAGHMFILYYAVLSAITPPVAVAAYAASSIAGANPITIAGHAVKFALAAFLVPFIFVFGPEPLWQGALWKTALTFVTAAVALVLLSGAIEHYEKWADAWWARWMLAIGAIFMITPSRWAEAVGVLLVVTAIVATRALKARAAA
jgi:TRAP-type uncharacterized transport system fused permease subunit